MGFFWQPKRDNQETNSFLQMISNSNSLFLDKILFISYIIII